MRIYNSATHKKEEFQPIESGKVRMYVCGPTVYDNIHIGNARTFISFDVIRRWLIASGYEVTFAQNLTDVDDKIIKRANEQGRTAAEVATEFSDKFIGVMRAANVLDPDVRPRATKEIGPMIAMIKTLIEQGHAYAADNGDVYFAVRSDPNYGQVSGRNIDDLMVGARIEENEDKNDPLDLPVEAAKPGEPSWPSPWGEGRPGWHTECAAMVHRYLGTPIDIHAAAPTLPSRITRTSAPRPPAPGTRLLQHLDAHGHAAGRWREDVQVARQLLYAGRGSRAALRCRPAPADAADELSLAARLFLGAPGGCRELAHAYRRYGREPALGREPCDGRCRCGCRRGVCRQGRRDPCHL